MNLTQARLSKKLRRTEKRIRSIQIERRQIIPLFVMLGSEFNRELDRLIHSLLRGRPYHVLVYLQTFTTQSTHLPHFSRCCRGRNSHSAPFQSFPVCGLPLLLTHSNILLSMQIDVAHLWVVREISKVSSKRTAAKAKF